MLRLYALDSPSEHASEAFEKVSTAGRKDPNLVNSADVIKPSLKLTGQHRGIISSIVQLPE